MYVYYTGWEMNCCGEPFCINDIIKLEVVKSINKENISLEDKTITLDYIYDGHYGFDEKYKRYNIKGTVKNIYLEYVEYVENKEEEYFYPVTKFFKPTNCTTNSEYKIKNLECRSFIIQLENTTITEIPFDKERWKEFH